MSTITMRPYNAINGQELKAILLKKADEAMEASGLFSLMLTYPIIKNAKISVEFQAYPHDPETETVVREVEIPMKNEPKPGEKLETFKVERELQGVGSEIAPDALREECGLGVPTPVKDSAGIVDRLMQAASKVGKK